MSWSVKKNGKTAISAEQKEELGVERNSNYLEKKSELFNCRLLLGMFVGITDLRNTH